jgi:8-oxo-dGTP diphosphatase
MSPEPDKMCVAADTVALRCSGQGAHEILLIERAFEPYKGCWAFPGGFVELDEDLPEAASRELEEETGLEAVTMDQVGAWGTPGRDPRGRTVSAVYLAIAHPEESDVEGGDDAARAAWHRLDDLPSLAFDHNEILPSVLAHLRNLCERTHVAFAFLPEEFTEKDLQRVLDGLGAVNPARGARKLLNASLVFQLAQGSPYRLDVSRYKAPLREPVFIFPIGQKAGE